MDDLWTFRKDEKLHIQHLNTVSSRLKYPKLYVFPTKCEFMKFGISFLGIAVGNEGIKVDTKKAEKTSKLDKLEKFYGYSAIFSAFR